MNDMTMSEEIIKVLDALGSKIGVAIDWTAENVMPYTQELFERFIAFEISTSIFYMVLWPLFMIAFFIVARCVYPHVKKVNYDFDYGRSWAFLLSIVAGCIFAVVSMIVIPIQVFHVITCNIIPEKIILDYLMQLM